MMDTKYVKGLDELAKFFDKLPGKLQKNVLRAALREGAKVVQIEAKLNLAANGSIDTGQLQRGLKISTNTKGQFVTAKVKSRGHHSPLAHLVEYGTKPHLIHAKKSYMLKFAAVYVKSVNHPGAKPKPFMRPALDEKAGAVLVAVGEGMKKRLTKAGLDTEYIEIEEVF